MAQKSSPSLPSNDDPVTENLVLADRAQDDTALTIDQTWARMRLEAATNAGLEPSLASFLHATILNHNSFRAALSYRLAQKLSDAEMNPMVWREVISGAFDDQPDIVHAAHADLIACFDRDPATFEYVQPFLYHKGYQGLQVQRLANWLWRHDRRSLALYVQSRMSELYGIDIHPHASFGQGVFIDHATGVVIGETTIVEDNVSILQSVTLGGTGKDSGDRHPKIRAGALISVGAKVLGNIEVGAGAKVAAGSVVLKDVPAGCTVAGVPAKLVGDCASCAPATTMDQGLD
ncbi:MAG: serine O-acetyltransferase [Pseudomonadota bacterium]